MNKRISSRAIIIENNKLLTFFRRKNKDGKIKEYYSLPGGGQEKGETLEENVIRELKEEFNVDIKIIDYLGKKESDNYIEHFFYCTIINGIPKLSGEELERNCQDNYYELRYININEIDKIDIFYKDMINKAVTYAKEK